MTSFGTAHFGSSFASNDSALLGRWRERQNRRDKSRSSVSSPAMRSHSHRTVSARPAFVQSLEGRSMLAYSPLPDGVAAIDSGRRLVVIGSNGNDNFTVTKTGARTYVTDVTNNAQSSFANAKIKKIIVRMRLGDDRLTLHTPKTPVLARGDYGNDTLIGGPENDDLFGDDGNDVIYGGAGNDLIEGNAGRDVLFAGGGADTIRGGTGADRIYSRDEVDNDVDIIDGGKGVSVDRLWVDADDIVTRNKNDIVYVVTRG